MIIIIAGGLRGAVPGLRVIIKIIIMIIIIIQ